MFRSDGAGVLRIPEIYKTDALASSWGCPKTMLRREDEQRDIPKGVYVKYGKVRCLYEILGTQSHEFRRTGGLCVISVRRSGRPTEIPSGDLVDICSGDLSELRVLRLSLVAFGGDYGCTLLYIGGGFSGRAFLPGTFSFSAGDAVVLKLDMHVRPSVITSDEVKNLVVEYAIPLDLHPCVPPSGLTMNRLPVNKIDAMPWRHQVSSVADPPPTGVRAEDICQLCENVIDLRLVHPEMLYAVGLTTIWKHVGHHSVFKDSEGTGNVIVLPLFVYVIRPLCFILTCFALSLAVANSMSQFLKFLMAGGVRVGKGAALAANEVIPHHTTPPLPSGS
ncbi:hypothetical protein Tco_0833021 [Tanacetum coccineum]